MVLSGMPLRDAVSESSREDAGTEPAIDSPTGFLRRTVLKAGAVTVGALGAVGSTAAQDNETSGQTGTEAETGQVDSPEGFSAEVLAPHAAFPDDVAAAFSVVYDEGDEETTFARDASNLVVVRATWEPGGTSGWHTHPGPVLVNVVQGELDIVYADDCVTHTYTAGEAFVDTGQHAEIATNPSQDEGTEIYAAFLGVPDEAPPTQFVEPRDC